MMADDEIEGTPAAEEVSTRLAGSYDMVEGYAELRGSYDDSSSQDYDSGYTEDTFCEDDDPEGTCTDNISRETSDADFSDGDDWDDGDPESAAFSSDTDDCLSSDTSMTLFDMTDPETDSILPAYGESSEIDMDSDTTKSSCSENETCTEIAGLRAQYTDTGTDADASKEDSEPAGLDINAEESAVYGALKKSGFNSLSARIIEEYSDITEPALTVESCEEDLVSASAWKTYYNAVNDFGANGGDSRSDEQALRNALYEAGRAAQILQQMVEVFVPKGTYHLKDTLFIFSNTWLHLAEGAVMYRDDLSKVMLLGVYLDGSGNIVHSENYKVGGYNQIRNVKISGGEWNGGAKASDAYASKCSEMDIVFRHGENITIENTTIGNDTATHSVNFDGCRNLTINNVKFINHYKYEGADYKYFLGVSRTSDTAYAYKEALHTDFISATDKGSNAKPVENLGMSGILVSNCTFQNVVAGLGTHHTYEGIYADGYKIQNCRFRDIPYICINARNFRDFVCKENTASNVGCFLQGYNLGIRKNSVSYIIDNTISGKKFSGVSVYPLIEIRDRSNVLVMNNTLTNVQGDGIRLYVGGVSGRMASAVMQAEVMKNRFYDGIGRGGGSSDYAAVRAMPGVKLTTWQNLMYLNGASSSAKIYGIYLYGCSDGCKLSTDYISGATTGIYVNTLQNLTIKQSEIIKASENGIYAANINGLSINGAKILSGQRNGLYICQSTNVTNTKSLALWNGGTDLILYNLYNPKDVSSFSTFMSGNYLSSGIKLPCIGYREGDVNFDGSVSSYDLSLLESIVRNNSSLTPAEMYIADLNKDKVVNWTDISILRSRITS